MTEVNETQNVQESEAPKHTSGSNRVNGRRKKNKSRKTALILLVILLLAGVAGGAYYYWKSQQTSMDNTTKYWFDKYAQDGSLEGKTPTEIQGMLNGIVQEGMFNVSINARAIFTDGTSEGSLGVENIPENRYYSRIILRMDETDEVLYESQGLKPGQFIDKIKLNRDLPAGEYPCTAQIIATDPESLDDIGQVQVKVQVIVVN